MGSERKCERTPASGRRIAKGAVALLAMAFCLGVGKQARADTKLAFDLDWVGGIDEPGVDPGAGGALRLGQELDLIVLSLTPEVGASYHSFGGDAELSHTSGFIGARLTLGKVLEPGVFAHLGVGHLSGAGDLSETAAAVDAGLSLDFTLLPVIDIGAHAAYDALLVSDADAFDWYRVGLHAALSF